MTSPSADSCVLRSTPSLKDQVAAGLRRAIAEGRYPAAKSLPPYRALAKAYGVSIATISEACGDLEKEGLVVRRQRRGVFPRDGAREQVTVSAPVTLQCINFVSSFLPKGSAAVHVGSDYLAGFSEALEPHFIKTRFVGACRDVASFSEALSTAVPLHAQGCVLVQQIRPELLRWLRERGVPFVVLEYAAYRREGAPPHHKVYVDKRRGGMEVARYLVGLGHTRFGFLGRLDLDPGQPGAQFAIGFQEVLRRSGLELRPEDNVTKTEEIPDRVVDRVRRLLDRPDRPTAVVSVNDAMAVGTVWAARALGLRVPEDLSVVGFNDDPGAATCDPPLTTVANPRRALARRAVELLLEVAARPSPAFRTEVLECHLVVRGSAAPPGGA